MSKNKTNTNTITDTSTADVPKRGRGRKPIAEGGKTSPRKIYVACAAIVDGKLVHEDIYCEDALKDTNDKDVVAEAKRRFEEKHKVAAQSVLEPKFFRQPVGVKKKRDTVDLDIADVNFESRKASAVYKDWNVAVKFVEGHDEAVYLVYRNHLTEAKKAKPNSKFVKISALQNLVEDSDEQQDTAE